MHARSSASTAPMHGMACLQALRVNLALLDLYEANEQPQRRRIVSVNAPRRDATRRYDGLGAASLTLSYLALRAVSEQLLLAVLQEPVQLLLRAPQLLVRSLVRWVRVA